METINGEMQAQPAERSQIEQHFRPLLEDTQDAVVIANAVGEIVLVNAESERYFGYRLDELIGKQIEALVPESARSRHIAHRRAYLAKPHIGEMGRHLELHALRKDGTQFPVEISLNPIHTEMGLYISCTVRDITERKQVEQALREGEERFRAIFDQAALGFAFMSPTGHWLRVNQKTCDILGYSAEELAQLTWRDITHPDDLQLDNMLTRRLLGGEIPSFSLDKRYIRKDETTVWVKINCSIMREPSGAPTRFGITVIEDITERKQAEEALRSNEVRYRTLMEQASDAIFLADAQANYVNVNDAACQMLGYTREELLQLNITDVVSPEDLAAVPIPWEAMRAGTVILERQLVRKDGTRLPVEVSAKVLDDGRLQVFARDISERKRAEKQQLALELEQEKVRILGQFIGDVSHDLRTPLSVMNTSVYLLRKTAESASQHRYLDSLEAQIAHIRWLIEDMLTLSRLDSGTSEFQFERCDVNALVRDVWTRQQSSAERKKHQIELRLAANLPPVLADQEEISSALTQLVVNAINYTADNGRIVLSTTLREQFVVIEISDTGIGIRGEDMALIFERFYRADKARRMDTGNSGLGLTIAKKIVEAHHGLIEAESRVGEGSIFRIVLPGVPDDLP